jgi:hypothetical protein
MGVRKKAIAFLRVLTNTTASTLRLARVRVREHNTCVAVRARSVTVYLGKHVIILTTPWEGLISADARLLAHCIKLLQMAKCHGVLLSDIFERSGAHQSKMERCRGGMWTDDTVRNSSALVELVEPHHPTYQISTSTSILLVYTPDMPSQAAVKKH